MMEYILDYLANKRQYASFQKEQDLIEAGISRYLFENGIEEKDTGEYYKNYVGRHLKTISAADLKLYFINYQWISDVNQIVIEYQCDGALHDERKRELYRLMEKLHLCGLGEKYVPIMEIKQILGKLS